MHIENWRYFAQDPTKPLNLKPSYAVAFELDMWFLRVDAWKNEISEDHYYSDVARKVVGWPVRFVAHLFIAALSAVFVLYHFVGAIVTWDKSWLGGALCHFYDVFANIFASVTPYRLFKRFEKEGEGMRNSLLQECGANNLPLFRSIRDLYEQYFDRKMCRAHAITGAAGNNDLERTKALIAEDQKEDVRDMHRVLRQRYELQNVAIRGALPMGHKDFAKNLLEFYGDKTDFLNYLADRLSRDRLPQIREAFFKTLVIAELPDQELGEMPPKVEELLRQQVLAIFWSLTSIQFGNYGKPLAPENYRIPDDMRQLAIEFSKSPHLPPEVEALSGLWDHKIFGPKLRELWNKHHDLAKGFKLPHREE